MASTYRYKPANTVADLSPQALKLGRKSMAEFLLSPQVQLPTSAAAADIADAARVIVAAEAFDTGGTLRSIDSSVGDPMVVDGNPRVTAVVTMHGGIYPGAKDPDSSVGAIVEFGNPVRAATRPLGRAGQLWHTPKGIA